MSQPTTRRRFVRLASAAALGLALVPARALAAEVEVSVTLTRPQVEVGQAVYLQVEVATDGRRIGDPRFSGLDEVAVTPRGTSSGMSVEISGAGRVQRSTKTFTYSLAPRKAGEYTIGVEVEVDGKLHRAATKPTLIASGDALEPRVEAGKAGDLPPSADAKVIVWPVVDKARVYVGEQIVYELQIWDRSRSNLSVSSAPTFKDFWSENLMADNPRRRRNVERRVLHGVPYSVHRVMRRALFPQKAGTLTIGGPEVEMQEFGGPFFGGTGPPQTFIGRGLAIEVLPLPAAGQPPGFRANNVGKFQIATEVDRTALRQGEAVRLTVKIAGTGNIALVELPDLPELAGLRSYEPKPQTPELELGEGKLEGSRVYTMLLVADEAGELTIPALELPYFDPETASYHVAHSRPITLSVEANPDAAPSATSPTTSPSAEVDDEDDELLAPPIAGGELERVTPREPWLTRERWWIGVLVAPGLLGLGWLGGRLLRRFGPDDDSRARAREAARRRTLLAEASAALESGEGFYPKLAALLQAAALGRAGAEGVGLTRDRLMKLLGERGVAASEIATLRELLDACDAARFGAGSGDAEQRRGHLDQARTLLRKRGWGAS